jgi:hypothetical protein
MKKYILFILTCVGFFSLYAYAHAEVVISEIAYDIEGTDQDREWIELYNNGESSISLSGFKFNDGANHNLNEPPAGGGRGALSIPPNGYIVIAQNASVFINEYPSYAGTVIDSVMALNNEGDTLSLVSDGTVIHSLTYTSADGASGDGNTLHKVGGSYIPGVPTPGSIYIEEESEEEVSLDTEEEESTKKEKEVISLVQPKIDIVTKTIMSANLESTLLARTTDERKQKIFLGKCVWNMGDGTEYQFEKIDTVKHTYMYQGEYVVTVEYYESILSTEPFLTDKVVLKVIEPDISVHAIKHKNGTSLIEIVNNSPLEIPFSSWILGTSGKQFVFPKNTVLLPNKKLFIPNTVTLFSVEEHSSVLLMYPNKQLYVEDDYSVKSEIIKQPKEEALEDSSKEKKEPWDSMPSITFIVLLLMASIGIIYSKRFEDRKNDEETGIIV